VAALAGMDPWGPYQLPELVEMARSRNDFAWAHDLALVGLINNLFAQRPAELEKFKPMKGF